MSLFQLGGAQHLQLMAGNLGEPGAPILHLNLIYNPAVTPPTLDGAGLITQAVRSPDGRGTVTGIHGAVYGLTFGKATRVFTLRGTYEPSPIEPLEVPFEATFVTDNDWKGEGGFSFGGRPIARVGIQPAE